MASTTPLPFVWTVFFHPTPPPAKVQERMAEAHKLQHELSRRDERTESLRDFGQVGMWHQREGSSQDET